MKTLIAIKSIVASLLSQTGYLEWRLKRLSISNYVILAYHRILPNDRVTKDVQAGMYVTPETLNSHLKYLQEYFDIITLEDLTRVCRGSFVHKPRNPFCVITFDDGWKDFYDFAFPLLVKYQVPATVFLPTGFIGTNKKFWTDRFAYILHHRQASIKNVSTQPDIFNVIQEIQNLQGSFEDQLESGIAILKKHSLQIIEKVLSELAKIWFVEFHEEDRDFVNWDEVKKMSSSKLIGFGSHTVGHGILTTLDKLDIEKELSASRNKLLDEGIVDPSFIPFCYPNGNYTQDIVRMVRSAGYHVAVTTKKGWNQFDTDMFTLNRISIHQDMTSTVPLFACRIAGFI